MTTDFSNNIYAACTSVIYFIAPNGSKSVYADLTSVNSGSTILGIAFDSSGNLFCCCQNNYIYKVDTSLNVTAYCLLDGSVNPNMTAPTGITVGSDDTLYVTCNMQTGLLVGISNSGLTVTIISSQMSYPTDVKIGIDGNFYVTLRYNHMIIKVTPGGLTTVFVGSNIAGYQDGVGSTALFNEPCSLTVDAVGNFFVLEQGNSCVRKILADGSAVSTYASASYDTSFFNTNLNFIVMCYNSVIYFSEYDAIVRVLAADQVPVLIPTISYVGSSYGTTFAGNYVNNNGFSDGLPSLPSLPSLLSLLLLPSFPLGVPYVTVLAGSLNSAIGLVDGQGLDARFGTAVNGSALDSFGNLYVSDFNNNVIRRIGPTGVVSFVAGLTTSSTSIDGLGRAASFTGLGSMILDSVGNLIVIDTNLLRKVDLNVLYGNVTTLFTNEADINGLTLLNDGSVLIFDASGNFVQVLIIGHGSVVTATSAVDYSGIQNMVVGPDGYVYACDYTNHCIYRISPISGGSITISVYAGTYSTSGWTDGSLSAALFNGPYALDFSSAGDLYVTEVGNSTVRKLSAIGIVSTYAGNGNSTLVNGPLLGASFLLPIALSIDPLTNDMFVGSVNACVRKIVRNPGVTSFISGLVPGPIAKDISGNLYVATATSIYVSDAFDSTLFVGGGSGDGTGAAAGFTNILGMVTDSNDNLWVTDGSLVRSVTMSGIVSTYLSVPGSVFSGIAVSPDTLTLYVTDTGQNINSVVGGEATAHHVLPIGCVTGSMVLGYDGNLYISDVANDVVYQFSISYSLLATYGYSGYSGLYDGLYAYFNSPVGLANDNYGNIIVADVGNNVIRKITIATGVVSTVVGNHSSGNVVGNLLTARFNHPSYVFVDTAGTLFISDVTNSGVKSITLF